MNKRIRKKQIRRAAARQGGGDWKIATDTQNFAKEAVLANRIVATDCKMIQIRNLEK